MESQTIHIIQLLCGPTLILFSPVCWDEFYSKLDEETGLMSFSTDDFRSGEYPMSLSYPAHLKIEKNRAADNFPDTGGPRSCGQLPYP